jgi:hypothetical protein
MGIPEEEIQRGRRWVHGTTKMHQYYLSNLPVQFARGIAGFKDKPFHLRHNEVVPPESLQELIFPFIESAYDDLSETEQKEWRQVYKNEMNDVDLDYQEGDEDDIRLKSIDTKLKLSKVAAATSNYKTKAEWKKARTDFAKKRLLKLLLRLRRVILQDGAALMHKGWIGPVFNNAIFRSEEFMEFKDEVVEALNRKETLILDNIPPSVKKTFQGIICQNDAMVATLKNEIKDLKGQLSQVLDRLDAINGWRQFQASYPPYTGQMNHVPQGQLYMNQYQEPVRPGHPGKNKQITKTMENANANANANLSRQLDQFTVPSIKQHVDTMSILSSIWQYYKDYLEYVFVKNYRRDSISSRQLKWVTNGRRIICWFLIQERTIREAKPNLSLSSAIQEAVDAFQLEQGRIEWNFADLYTACSKLVTKWEKEQLEENGRKANVMQLYNVDEVVQNNELEIVIFEEGGRGRGR